MQTVYFPNGPATHETIIPALVGSWNTTIAYADDPWTYYLSSNKNSVARNRFVWEVSRAENPDAKLGQVSLDATHALLRVKLKAHIPLLAGGGQARVQANCRFVTGVGSTGVLGNHFIHVDEQNNPSLYNGEARRIPYTVIAAPISPADQVIIDVTRMIIGRGIIEWCAYLEGYCSP